MKKIILISILLYSISCSFRHTPIAPGGKNNKIEYMKISVLPDTIRFSNNFRMLWDDLLKEANGYLSSKDYTPSEQLREKYNLKYFDGKYYIKGYLHTRPDFDKNKAESQGISIVSYTDTLKSFSCLISQLPELITLPDISAIELSKSINLRLPKKY
ncbi:hypothetical protein [Coprobacter fastidiosus]|uniref:Uncharacterized protein n=1 Tax=Coprobacter fastidiosus NSB1 = JCM 33896 TaxID=1349822 RepID=A0A495WJB2_9BACT|nr:hypothetical protein [Coprobacter fastidiosus]ERM89042.1 hypothetical protein NSB1T_07200 [Coprobacter fastidiosus NSB1 = JCM 33896]RKT61469.1 hypothetical protein BC742_0516 [Coprobacter fastidiosus NSB1 = JCM 33896]